MKEFEDVELYDEWDDEWDDEEEEELEPVDWSSFSKEEYIEMVKSVYQHPDSFIMQDYEEKHYDYDETDFKELFSKYPQSDWIVTKEEKDFYDNLPDEIEVYRGCTEENKDGISWTTNYFVARYFAFQSMQYQNKDTDIYKKTIKKTDIRAVLLDMDESEIILVN